MTQAEGMILLWIQEHLRVSWLTPIMQGITSLGNAGWFWILTTALLMLIPTIILRYRDDSWPIHAEEAVLVRYRWIGFLCMLALWASFIITNLMLKTLVDRTRPYEVISGLICITRYPKDSSFPSGHTSASIAAAWVLFREMPRRWGVPALALAILIGFSRLYVGVHFPTDVLAGAAIGVLSGELGRFLGERIRQAKTT